MKNGEKGREGGGERRIGEKGLGGGERKIREKGGGGGGVKGR